VWEDFKIFVLRFDYENCIIKSFFPNLLINKGFQDKEP
jgi:hypothetical protein